MFAIRAFVGQHRLLAGLIVLAALCLKIMVPTGYMIGQNANAPTIQLCTSDLAKAMATRIAVPMKGDKSDQQDGGKAAQCPFTALSTPSIAGAPPMLLVLALAFIMALGFAPVRTPSPKRAAHLRPPLRGPPARA